MPLYAAVRAFPGIVLVIFAVTLITCAGWLIRKDSTYEASSQILVTPLTEGQTSFVGLPIIRTSPGDPTRTVQTAASVADSPDAAEIAAEDIGGLSGGEVQAAIDVEPIEGTNVITITAAADDPELAAELATAYAEAVIQMRKELLEPLVHEAIRRTERELAEAVETSDTKAALLRDRLSQLEAIRGGEDPTLAVSRVAEVPNSSTGRPSWQLLVLAGFAGALLGLGTVVLVKLAAPVRIEDDKSLRAQFELPIYARIPSGRAHRRSPWGISPTPAVESGFHLLQAQLAFRAAPNPSESDPLKQGSLTAVMEITPGDGATISAAGLIRALIQASDTVVAVDLEPNRPGLRELLQVPVEPRSWLTSASNRDTALTSLITAASDDRHLGLLVADPGTPELRSRVEEIRSIVDHVVIDIGSTHTVRAVLPILHDVDHLVLVARLGHTRPTDLASASELLLGTGMTSKAGYVLLDPSTHGT